MNLGLRQTTKGQFLPDFSQRITDFYHNFKKYKAENERHYLYGLIHFAKTAQGNTGKAGQDTVLCFFRLFSHNQLI